MRALAAVLAGAAILATAAAGNPVATIHPECVKAADHARTVYFRTADKVRLAGVLFGKGPKGVVLAHQSRGDLCTWVPYARTLARAGYLALPFDLRGYGRSGSGKRPDFQVDVAAAGRALRAAGAKRVVYLGASLGGTASLAATPLAPEPDGVISLSGPASFGGLDGTAAVRKVDAPLLLVAAKGDTAFSGDQKTVYDAAVTADKQVLLVSGFDHGVDLLTGDARVRVKSLVLAFLRKQLA
jgi:alpha-beta hydrolase superfamily lysophospholipase